MAALGRQGDGQVADKKDKVLQVRLFERYEQDGPLLVMDIRENELADNAAAARRQFMRAMGKLWDECAGHPTVASFNAEVTNL